MPKITLKYEFIPLQDLHSSVLPTPISDFPKSFAEPEKLDAFNKVFANFNLHGDDILNSVFDDSTEHIFDVTITTGLPSPYDAWTIANNGSPKIFFNLDEWTIDEIHSAGIRVVIHEVTHALLHPFLKNMDITTPIGRLNKIVIDEGIAHFIGFPGDRADLLTKWRNKWEPAEEALKQTYTQFTLKSISSTQESQLLQEADTGSFWSKYGAISGMFRAANIYSQEGGKGLKAAIHAHQLLKK
ncbi:MAG: hypothetical protein J7501_18335 [Bdellovibrio sp.]|nr:hypothetical protein [Bdellovibrio sp.]